MKNSIAFVLSFTLVMCLFPACNKSQSVYVLSGKTHEMENGTVLYLKSAMSNKLIDSCCVVDDEFMMKGSLPDSTLKVVISAANSTSSCSFWIENTKMTFDASKMPFNRAVVYGSKTQDDYKKMLSDRDNFSTDSLSAVIQKEAIDLMQSEKSWRGVKGKEEIALRKLDNLEKEWDLLDCMYEMQYVRDYPNSIISAYLLSFYATTWGKTTVESMFAGMSPELRKSEYGLKIKHFIDVNRLYAVGDSIKDFSISDREGKEIHFADLKDKCVLLQFWSSMCGPCVSELPDLLKLYHFFKPKGFEVLAVSIDKNRDSWIDAVDRFKLDWINTCDLVHDYNDVALMFGVSRVPFNILVDRKGKIVAIDVVVGDLPFYLKEII